MHKLSVSRQVPLTSGADKNTDPSNVVSKVLSLQRYFIQPRPVRSWSVCRVVKLAMRYNNSLVAREEFQPVVGDEYLA